jgi:hypothetical protein
VVVGAVRDDVGHVAGRTEAVARVALEASIGLGREREAGNDGVGAGIAQGEETKFHGVHLY